MVPGMRTMRGCTIGWLAACSQSEDFCQRSDDLQLITLMGLFARLNANTLTVIGVQRANAC